MTLPHVTIYSDGSYKKKYNAGGWACLLTCGPHWRMIADGEREITISRAELTAVLKALQQLTCPCEVEIFSDSTYTVNCINKWIAAWEENNWRTQTKEPVANQDLLFQIRDMMRVHMIRAHWVKSHTKRKGEHYLGNAVVDCWAQFGSEGLLN